MRSTALYTAALSAFLLATACGDSASTVDAPHDGPPGQATLAIDAASVQFGSVTVGETSPAATFTITNTGSIATGLLAPSLTGDSGSFHVESTTCGVLAPAASCQVLVRFAPASPGVKAGVLHVAGAPGGEVTATLDGTGVAPGALTISASTNALGSVVVGTTGTTVATFTVTNTGGVASGPLTVQPAGSDPDDILLGADLCSGQSLAAAATCTFTAQLAPRARGAKTATFVVTANPGGTVTGAVSGLALAPARLIANAAQRDLGSIVLGQTSAASPVVITNIGDVATDALTTSITDDPGTSFASSGCAALTLAPGASCTVLVRLTPTTTGDKVAQLRVGALTGDGVTTFLAGRGISATQLVIAPSTLDLGNAALGDASAAQTFTITNNGTAASGVLSTTLGGLLPGQFQVVAGLDTCEGTSLAASAQCTIRVRFAPSIGGPASAQLAVASSGAGVATAGVFALGVTPARLVISPLSQGFGGVATSTHSPTHAFTITNLGGVTSGVPSVALTGTQASQFDIVGTPCTVALAPGARCIVDVRFSPTAVASAAAALEVTGTPGGTVSAPLSGEGIAGAQLAVIPASFVFSGSTAVGDTADARSWTVINLGAATTGTLAIATTGAGSADYTVSNDCTTLAPLAVCTITSTFAPSVVGERNAAITVTGAPGGTATIALAGAGVPRLEVLSVDGGDVIEPFAFADTIINTSTGRDVLLTLRNHTSAAHALAVSSDSSAFAPIGTGSCGGTISADGTCTVQIRFTPPALGAQSGTLTFSIGATPEDDAVEHVSGNGIASLLLAPVTTASYGTVPRLTTSAPHSFRVTNPLGSPTTGALAITLSGAGFQLRSNGCTGITLASGASCLVDVVFAPTAAGAVTGTLTAAGSPGGSPSLTLTAEGVDPIGAVPTAITLAPSTVAENQPAGTVVGALAATDADAADTFTFTLVPGAGSTDNGSFAITGNQVTTRAAFDFEVKTSYAIRVLVTDSGGQQLEQPLTITVTNVDEAPTAVNDVVTVAEDSGATTLGVLANDTDVDGGPKTVTTATQPAHGVVTVIGGGSAVTYAPEANYNGSDSFTYTLNGGSVGTVSITVSAVDDAPVAVNDSATLAEDSGATAIDVLANDTDIDGGPKTVTAVTQPAHGTVVITGGGTGLTYTPTANTNGADSFTYTLNGGSTATVSISVSPVDDLPVAVNDSASVAEDSAATALDVLANDTDIDGGTKVILSVTQPAHGAVVITGGIGSGVTYAPTANYNGPDTFTYTLNGGSTGTVSITVTPVDDAPVAVGDNATVAEDSGATAIPVLANDTDIDAGPKTITGVTQPSNGTAVITGGGTGLTYAPAANFNGTDTFTYTLNGGSTATISITVSAVDDAPVAVADTVSVGEDSGATAIAVLTNDTDIDAGPMTITGVTQPAHGSVVITGGGTGLTYAPTANYNGGDSFTYTLNGGSTATVSITVTAVDDAPVAVADSATVVEDSGANAIDVVANDTDIDGGPKTVATVTQPAHGTVVITGAGTGVTYAPVADYAGADSFTYTLTGGSTAIVSITVTAVDDAPIAVADTATVAEDSSATAIPVLTNDTDVDGGPKTIGTATQPAHGTVVITGGGTGVTYVPAANYSGADSFTYTLTGGSTATVSITVTAVDDAPVAVADSATVAEDTGATAILVLPNDTDIDAGPKTVNAVSQGAHGTVVITGGGTGLTYAPAANYNGADSFTYTLNGGSSATVSITVTAVDDAPVAVNDSATVTEDGGANAVNVLSNDTDIDGGPKTVSSVTQGAHGAVVITGGGTGVTYAPAADYAGADSFTYTLNGGSTATVSVTVTGLDDAPVAVNDSATVAEDSGATAIAVLANDTDIDGGPKTVTSVTQPTSGSVVITGGGTGLTFAPAANVSGSDSFTYTLNGGSTATVSITVTPVDDAPTAVNDAATVVEASSATTLSVLANDTDIDAGPKAVGSVTQPAHGTAVITGGGTGVSYAPAAGYCNSNTGVADTFTYTLTPGASTATVSMTVTCLDDPPVAVDDAATISEDAAPTAILVLANDTDADGGPKSVASVTQPANGAVVITGGGTGLTYAPNADYCAPTPDTFTYALTPGGSVATVSVTVTCVDDAPVAVADTATVLEDSGATTIAVLTNDTDIDGGTKTVLGVSTATNGTVAVTGGGTGVSYQPAAGFCGTDSFTYTLNGSSSATVTMTVTCVNDAPSFTVGPDKLLLLNQDVNGGLSYSFPGWATAITANDSGQTVSFNITGNSNAAVFSTAPTVSPAGTLSFITNPAVVGSSTISLELVDDGGTQNGGVNTSVTKTFVISTRAPAPIPVDDAYAATGNVSINVNVSAEGVLQRGTDDTLFGATITKVGGTASPAATLDGVTPVATANGGTVVLQTDGTFLYEPPAGFTGADKFFYNLHNSGGDVVGTVTVTVTSMIWFFDASAATAGTGTRSKPFKATSSFVNDGLGTHGKINQTLFFATGTYPSTSITLLDGQRVLGQGATIGLATFANVVLPAFSASLPSTSGTRPVLTSTATTLQLKNNELRGFDLGAATTALGGVAGTTTTISELAISTTGQALNIGAGNLSGAIDSITSTGGATNVSLTNVSTTGTFALGGGALSGATGDGFVITGGNGTFTYGGTIDDSSASSTSAAVRITSKSGGAVTLSGNINGGTGTRPIVVSSNTGGTYTFTGKKKVVTSAGAGISLTNNTSATIAFTGGSLAVTATGVTGVDVSGGGTVSITGASNVVTSTNAPALSVANTTIAGAGLVFESISTTGGTSGIVLDSTGAGGLSVTGTASTSGGTIKNTTSYGVKLTNASNVSLTKLTVQTTGASGISGSGVTNFTFANGTVSGSGTAVGHANIAFNGHGTLTGTNLTGTLSITNSTLGTAFDSAIDVQNSAGTISSATITGNTISSSTDTAQSKGNGINLIGTGSASAAAVLTAATISGNTVSTFPSGAGIQVNYGNSDATGPAGSAGTPGGSAVSITGNTVRGASPTTRLGTSAILCTIEGGRSTARSKGNFLITGNGTIATPVGNSTGITLLVSNNGYADTTAVVANNVIAANNILGAPGISGANGPGSAGAASTPVLTMTVANNNVSQVDGNGLLLVGRGATGQANFTVSSNTVAAPLGSARPGIRIDAGNATSLGDNVCLDINTNTTAGSGGEPGIALRRDASSGSVNNAFGVEGMAATASPGVEIYVGNAGGKNPGTANGTTGTNGVRLLSFPTGFSNCGTAP